MTEHKVLAVTSEIYPLVKTGGLADVTGALAAALAREGFAVRTLIPGYPSLVAKLAAPSVRFRVRAILAAGVFRRASDFSSRTCAGVQACLLDAFLCICIYDPANKEVATHVVRKC